MENGRILFLFVLAVAFTAGGCPEAPGRSDGIQAETDSGNRIAERGREAVTQEGRESGMPSGNTKPSDKEETCKQCHEEQARFHAYGVHADVSCATCHGVRGDHIEMKTKPLVRGNEQCIECHALVEGPEAGKLSEKEVLEHHLQFVEKKHVIKVKREKVKDRCIYCHDPHLGQ